MEKNNGFICLIMGRSGSGKTTLALNLEKRYGYTQIQSYTTRPKRYGGEIGHIFVDKQTFNSLTDMVAYTEYNGYQYCATSAQVEENQIYVIDPDGIIEFAQRYKGDKKVIVIYLHTSFSIRNGRMLSRGDGTANILKRNETDRRSFSEEKINKITELYPHFYTVNASNWAEAVCDEVSNILLNEEK